MSLHRILTGFLLATLLSAPAHAGVIRLFDRAYQLDTVFSGFSSEVTFAVPTEVDETLFDLNTGLGSITATITGAGAHSFDFFVDHDIDDQINTFFNESGTAVNTGDIDTRMSWEIDEPGYLFGDIDLNVIDSTLDNFNNVPAGLNDDVSMALGFDFNLSAHETATIIMEVLTDAPLSGFYLQHTDPESDGINNLYFRGALSIAKATVPEPGTAALLSCALLGLWARRRSLRSQALPN